MSDETDAWAKPDDIADVWRPLKPAEAARATKLIGTVSRAIRREWPDVPDRLADGTLDPEDVTDVIVWSILPILAPGVEIPPNAKSYQETSGSESRSVVLNSPGHDVLLEFAGWMVRVFEAGPHGVKATTALPRLRAPKPRIDRAFPGLAWWDRSSSRRRD
jgi:hypothetical protein